MDWMELFGSGSQRTFCRLATSFTSICQSYTYRIYLRGADCSQKALGIRFPAGRVPDNEAYADLRPGVIVASQTLGDEICNVMTTSGVCLQSPYGKKYITVAKSGFPEGEEGTEKVEYWSEIRTLECEKLRL